MTLKIALSEGHGLHTAGKRTPDGEREWTFNNLMGQGYREEMGNYHGVVVRLVSDPTGKRDVPLNERTDIANQWGADLYESFHHNAYRGIWGSHTGTETYVYSGAISSRTLPFAQASHKGIVDVYKLHDRGIKRANFHELRIPKMPACLTEGGYMDSTIDIKVMRNKELVKEAGRNVAREVAKLYGLKRKSHAPVTEVTGTIYRVQLGAFEHMRNAVAFASQVEQQAKVDTYIVETDKLVRIQVGAFTEKANADRQLKRLKDAGYSDAFITTKDTQAIVEAEPQNEPVYAVPKPSAKLTVDGYWGKATTLALQKALGTYQDGIISGQYDTATVRAISSTTRGTNGSLLIRALQKKVGVKADGLIGPDTIRALQRYLGTPVDGIISRPSTMVRAMQRRLNAGTF